MKDRRRWLQWLFEARRRYGIIILNYTITSNHIHLLVVDEGGRDVIPDSIKLVAGRTAQEYNLRKKRKGAFGEDRYHATAVNEVFHLREEKPSYIAVFDSKKGNIGEQNGDFWNTNH